MNVEDVDNMIAKLEELKTELKNEKPPRCPTCSTSISRVPDNLASHMLGDRPYLLPVTNQYTGQAGTIEFCSRSCQSSFEDRYVRYK